MKHNPSPRSRRPWWRWLLPALLVQAALCACGSSTVPAASSGNTGATALHCAPATAKPDAAATQTVALCAPPPQGHS